jgi:polar amino acid transport system substrate-binding protein
MKHARILFQATGLSLALLAGTVASPARAADAIVAGSITNSPPMIAYKDDGRTLQGVIVELAQAMSKHLPRPITFKSMPFPGILPALKARQIDIAFTLMNDTPERQKVVDFVDFFNISSKPLLRHGNPDHVSDLASLCGKKVSTVKGSTELAVVAEGNVKCKELGRPPIENMQYAQPADARMQVQTGRVSAFFGMTPVIVYIGQKQSGNFQAGPGEYRPTPIGIALPKGETKLRDQIQAALNAIIADGTYLKILKKYGVESGAVQTATINGAKGSQ